MATQTSKTMRALQQLGTSTQSVAICLANARLKFYLSTSYSPTGKTLATVTKPQWPSQYSHYLARLCLRSTSNLVHFSNRHPQTFKFGKKKRERAWNLKSRDRCWQNGVTLALPQSVDFNTTQLRPGSKVNCDFVANVSRCISQ